MNEHISVLTRAKRREIEKNSDHRTSVDNISKNDWTDHPRVVEMLKLPKDYTELVFVIRKEEWVKVKKCVSLEIGDYAYSSSERTVYVKLFTRSQRT